MPPVHSGSARDKIGFTPGRGVHDIHMKQGNSPRFSKDDGVWQDGGLMFWFPKQGEWVAVFLKFQSQAIHTDDTTGHTLPLEAHLPIILSPAARGSLGHRPTSAPTA